MDKQFLLQNDLKNTRALLALAEAQLREILDKLKNNIPPASIKGAAELDKLFGFSTQYEAKILVLQTVGDEENLKAALTDLLKDMLTDTILMQDFLVDKKQITESSLVDFANFKLRRLSTTANLNEAADIATMGENLKLNEAKNYSVDTLLRQITRSVAIDADFDREVSSFLMRLLYEAHKDDRVLPLILRGLNKDDIYSQSFDFADTQAFRDQAGGSLAALIKWVVGRQRLNTFDDVFKNAYSAAVKFLIGIYTTALNGAQDLRRTPQEVEEIKNELLSDIEIPDAPVAPAPPAAAAESQSVQISAEQVKTSKAPTASQSMPIVPKPPMPPKPPINSGQNIAANTPNPPAENSKDIQSVSSATIAPSASNTPATPQNKGNVAINKIERPAPPKDNVNPIQRIDLN